jgi:hypothetical protein
VKAALEAAFRAGVECAREGARVTRAEDSERWFMVAPAKDFPSGLACHEYEARELEEVIGLDPEDARFMAATDVHRLIDVLGLAADAVDLDGAE